MKDGKLYKVYGYACFYQADTNQMGEIKPEELTITFVTNHYLRKMVEHIKRQKGIEVRQWQMWCFAQAGRQWRRLKGELQKSFL